MNILEALPAYGRDYASRKALLADWDANRDFCIEATHWREALNLGRHGYVNKQQLEELKASGVRYINVRYKCLSQVCVIKL